VIRYPCTRGSTVSTRPVRRSGPRRFFQDRCGDLQRAQLRSPKSGGDDGANQQHQHNPEAAPQEPGGRRDGGENGTAEPPGRLQRQSEIDGDPGAEADRQPETPARALGKQASEQPSHRIGSMPRRESPGCRGDVGDRGHRAVSRPRIERPFSLQLNRLRHPTRGMPCSAGRDGPPGSVLKSAASRDAPRTARYRSRFL